MMYPLILQYRLTRYLRENPIRLGEGPVGWAQKLAEADPRAFQHERRRGGHEYLHVAQWAVENRPTLSMMADELRLDRTAQGVTSDAAVDLTALLLARGETHSYYGREFLGAGAMHVLTAGIAWERSTSPTAERWREFAGTFEESDNYRDVLGMTVECRCPEGVHGWREQRTDFGIDMPSVANVIVALSAGELERLFPE